MSSLNRYPIFLLLLLFILGNTAYAQGWDWARRANANKFLKGSSVVTDRHGNIYAVMDMWDPIVHVGSSDVHANGCRGSVLARYDSTGNVIWTKVINSSCGAYAGMGSVSVTTDNHDNILVTGWFSADSLLSGSLVLVRSMFIGSGDMFVIKYDPDGNVIWAKASNAGGRSADPSSISADSFGNIYIAGNYWEDGTLSFGTVSLTFSDLGAQMFLVKYDSMGNALWARKADDPHSAAQARFSAVDKKGNVYVAGDFSRTTLSFSGVTVLNTGGTTWMMAATNIFLAKFSPNNDVLWVKAAGSTTGSSSVPEAITTDRQGNVLMTGLCMSDSIIFDNDTLVINTPPGSWDMFLVKYDSSGNAQWARGATGKNVPMGIVTDDTDNIYVAGYYIRPVIFGSTVLPIDNTDTSTRLMLVKYNAAGDVKFARTASSFSSYGQGITCDHSGNIYIIGNFQSDYIHFDFVAVDNSIPGSGHQDMFLVKINPSLHFLPASTTGINEPAFLLFPNPATNNIVISAGTIITSIELSNTLGQVVYATALSDYSQQATFSISHLPSGVYFARVNGISAGKVVKQ